MLGKRFRRTTSMSHLGPSSPPPSKVTEKAPLHSLPHKAAMPLLFTPHINSDSDAVDEQAANHVCHGGVNVIMPGCAIAAVSEESCAVDHVVVCNDMDMEGMVASMGCEDNRSEGITAYCCGAMSFSDTMMMEGNHDQGMVQVNGGMMMMKGRHCPEQQAPASLMAYQMGLWIQNSMNGSGKLLEEAVSPVDFLDVCFHCKRRLRHERDIYIYRGDTAFCSEECRYRQIVKDERRSSRANNKINNASKRGRSRATSSSSETAVAA